VESPASGNDDADANVEAAHETGKEPAPPGNVIAENEEDKGKAVKGGEDGEEGAVPRSKYEAALVKIGAMTRKAKEMEAAMASVAGSDKGEAQKLARSATEAKHALEAEASKRDAEVRRCRVGIGRSRELNTSGSPVETVWRLLNPKRNSLETVLTVWRLCGRILWEGGVNYAFHFSPPGSRPLTTGLRLVKSCRP